MLEGENKLCRTHYKWWLKHFAKVDVAFKVSTQQRKGLGFCEWNLSHSLILYLLSRDRLTQKVLECQL